MEIINAIAKVLNISENQIKCYEEWAKVYLVQFNVGRPKFVSKLEVGKHLPLNWTLKVGRRQYRAWIAKLIGLDQRYGFSRKFIDGVTTEWGRKEPVEQQFTITEPGLYQDSDGDYFEVRYVNGKLDFTRYMCKDEAKTIIANIRIPDHA